MKYLPYADSPTVKSYTRWERFEEALEKVGEASVSGVERSVTALPEPENWFMEEHVKRAVGFRMSSGEVRVASKDGMSFVHIEGELDGTLLVVEDSSRSPLSVTGRLEGRGTLLHLVRGNGPHFSRWEVVGDVRVHTLVEGRDVYLRYVGSGNIRAFGVSRGERTDVNHLFTAGNITNVHLLVGEAGTFHVHRPLVRVEKGGKARVETLLYKNGGFVAAVPSMEVLTNEVEEAAHSVADIVPSEDHLFYLRTRGLDEYSAKKFVLEELEHMLLGGLARKWRV